MNWGERHSALGPSSLKMHSAKLLSALISLCETRQDAPWVQPLKIDPDVISAINSDVDKGGKIAVGWLAAILPLIAGATQP